MSVQDHHNQNNPHRTASMATSTPLNIDNALGDIITRNSSSNPTFHHHDLPICTPGLAPPKRSVTFADRAGLGLVEEKVIYDGDLRFCNARKPTSTLPLRPAIANRKRRREEEEEDDHDPWRGKRGREMAPSPEPIVPTVMAQNWTFDNADPTLWGSSDPSWPTPPTSSPMPAVLPWMTDVPNYTPALAPSPASTDVQIGLPDYVDSSEDESCPMPTLATFYAAHCPPSQEIEMESIEEPCFPEPEMAEFVEQAMSDYDYDDHNEPPPFASEAVSVSVETVDSENDDEDEVPAPTAYPEQTPFDAETAAFLNTPLHPVIIENIHPSSLADFPNIKRYTFMIEELLANGAALYESAGEDYWAAIYRTKLEEFVLTRTGGAFDASETFVEIRYKLEQDEMARDNEMARLMEYEEEAKQKKQQQQQRKTAELREVRRLREAEAQQQQKKRHDKRKKEEKQKHQRDKNRQDSS